MLNLKLLLICMLLYCVLDANSHPIVPQVPSNQTKSNSITDSVILPHDSHKPITKDAKEEADIAGQPKRRETSSTDSVLKNTSSNCEHEFLCKNLKTFHNLPFFILFFHWHLHDSQIISGMTEETTVTNFLTIALYLAAVIKIIMTLHLLPQMDKQLLNSHSNRNYLQW